KESLKVAKQAVELARATKDDHVLGLALNGLGNAYRDFEQPAEAADCYHEALPLLERTDRELLGAIYRNIARVYLKAGQTAEALENLDEAISIYQDLNLLVEEAESMNYHARILARLGEFENALAEVDYARKIFENLGSVSRLEEISVTLSMIPTGKLPLSSP